MSRYLLDTNVVSELARPRPDAGVVSFLRTLHELSLPAIVLFELERGIRRLPAGKRRRGLESWLEEWLPPAVLVLPVDAAVARSAASIEERARKRGRTIDGHDLLVVATAEVHGLVLASRNVLDLEGHGVDVHDPFTR